MACHIPRFVEAVGPVIQKIVSSLNAVGSKSKENALASDNLTAALGQVLDKFEDKLPHGEVEGLWALWLDHLPIKEDEDEVC